MQLKDFFGGDLLYTFCFTVLIGVIIGVMIAIKGGKKWGWLIVAACVYLAYYALQKHGLIG